MRVIPVNCVSTRLDSQKFDDARRI